MRTRLFCIVVSGFFAGSVLGDEKLIDWRASANAGNVGSQFMLGRMYTNGIELPKDEAVGFDWYRQAAQGGNQTAMLIITNSAESGNQFAQHALGLLNEIGRNIPRNSEQAVYWYKKSAEQGFKFAQWNLGELYEKGSGVPVDLSQALHWYRKAIKNGLSNDSALRHVAELEKIIGQSVEQKIKGNSEIEFQPSVKFITGVIFISVLLLVRRYLSAKISKRANSKKSFEDEQKKRAGNEGVKKSDDSIYHATVLGLKGKVSPSDIKKAYKEQLTKYHPDKVNHLGEDLQKLAKEKTIKIISSYEYFKRKYNFE